MYSLLENNSDLTTAGGADDAVPAHYKPLLFHGRTPMAFPTPPKRI